VQTAEVILVHGLDDPGKVWMNLAPVLLKEGFSVWIMTYPNDQPRTESAQFFLKHLKSHNASGTGSISIVAHSMGGLVAREMLTDPSLSYAERTDKGELPAIEQLIMVGTPNHGSGLAQFRIFTEFRDQLRNLFKGNYHWLQGIIDGAGEAGIDLIPGSKFLVSLNSRPHPRNVSMLVIAGLMSPGQKYKIEELAHNLEAKLPGDTRVAAKQMENVLFSVSKQVGDGLVSVNSNWLSSRPTLSQKTWWMRLFCEGFVIKLKLITRNCPNTKRFLNECANTIASLLMKMHLTILSRTITSKEISSLTPAIVVTFSTTSSMLRIITVLNPN